ncbi:MAG: hypothetical protein ABIF22_02085 [bacterium]
MNSRSNISVSLNRKRQKSFIKKLFAYFIFILFSISLAVLGLTNNKVRIKEIIVSGNFSVSTLDIIKLANSEINKYYLWIIPTDNLFLLRRSKIENQVLDYFKKIGYVKVWIRGIDKIEITIKERESKNLWCKGTPISSKDCYFMDSSGFVFEEAPKFSEDTFPEYFGLITEVNPIGQIYFKDNFKNIFGLYNGLKNMSFEPKRFNALNEHEYEVYILGGGKILVNDKKSFESSLINLQALIDNKYIKNDAVSLKTIKYIDLRFGNKVNFELKTSL